MLNLIIRTNSLDALVLGKAATATSQKQQASSSPSSPTSHCRSSASPPACLDAVPYLSAQLLVDATSDEEKEAFYDYPTTTDADDTDDTDDTSTSMGGHCRVIQLTEQHFIEAHNGQWELYVENDNQNVSTEDDIVHVNNFLLIPTTQKTNKPLAYMDNNNKNDYNGNDDCNNNGCEYIGPCFASSLRLNLAHHLKSRLVSKPQHEFHFLVFMDSVLDHSYCCNDGDEPSGSGSSMRADKDCLPAWLLDTLELNVNEDTVNSDTVNDDTIDTDTIKKKSNDKENKAWHFKQQTQTHVATNNKAKATVQCKNNPWKQQSVAAKKSI